ncbi:MAG: FlgD immunoglobulin-like domain containing protein [candidate division Zixibacteria bacterium]
MKQNKLLILSLLASFLLLTLASYANAQNTVTFGILDVCPQPAGSKVYVPVSVDNDIDLFAIDIVGQIVSTSGGVDLVVTGVVFDNRMGLPEVLDQRYPIGDLGGGLFRLGAVKVEGADLVIGSGQVATLELEFVSECLLGSASIDPGAYNCNGDDKVTMFLDGEGTAIYPDPVTSGAVNVVNTDPQFTNCPESDFDIFWKSGSWGTNQVTIAFTVDDPDLDCDCDALAFTLMEGPGSVNSANGVYSFTATSVDIGCHHVKIKVNDSYGGEDFCEFDITVNNNPPEITECPDETINILWGQTAMATVAATDPDMGPSALVYTLESYDGPVSSEPVVNPTTGAVTWATSETNDFIGDFEICVKVSDLAPSTQDCPIPNSAVCCFNVHVEPKFRVTIEKSHDVYLGHYTDLTVTLDDSYESMEMGGFDFLIAYDQSVLSLVDAQAGALLETCGWEYFTYRHGYDGNCGNGCPSGAVRIVAMAETNNGPFHPTCFSSASGNELAVLKFYVINDHNYDCQYVPVTFFWMDCADNAISSKFGDTLFLEDVVYNLEGDIISAHGGFPNALGTDDACLTQDEEQTKEYPLRAIDFKNGGVDIICDSLIDDRGDVNMNGIAYEIADAVMFTNYFISGLSAFSTHVEGSIAASDANADGATLTVADLVYLVRVIQGDALPYQKPDPNASFTVKTQMVGGNMNVGIETTNDAGAALFVFNVTGEIGQPILADGVNMDIAYDVDNGELRILVYNIDDPEAISSGELLTIPANGTIDLREVEAADFNGSTMASSIHVLPSSFALAQNYPNPFNPTTTIMLALPVASEFTLEIYNIAGQSVRTYTGSSEAGVVEIVWDGKDTSGSSVASGIYLYKVKAADYSATRSMILLK